MESRVIKRRGRPNRGGGRPNRGGRGRGRGRGSAQTAQPHERQTPRGASGISGRKGGSALFDDDDIYDAYEDDDESFDFIPSVSQRSEEKRSGFSQFRGAGQRSEEKRSGFSQFRGAGNSRGFRGRRGQVKVTMQHLSMSTANQELVKDMLKDLHGDEVDITSEEEYDELDHRAEDQYWIVNNQLRMEDSVAYGGSRDRFDEGGESRDRFDEGGGSRDRFDEGEVKVVTVSTLAVNKLTRYGFHKTRSKEALQVCDGDLGLALEYLLAECFSLKRTEDDVAATDDTEEIVQLRNDEMMALQSIYEDKFVERIPNCVWTLKIPLPYLDKLVQPKNDRKQTIEEEDNRQLCRFYLKGFCKFGKRCRLKHSKPESKKSAEKDCAIDVGKVDSEYELEVRFPIGNCYPKEAPFIAFNSTSSLLDKHVCLNITKHMMVEAKKMAESEEPSIFTVVSLLDDESFLEKVLDEAPHEFSFSVNNALLFQQHGRQEKLERIQTGMNYGNALNDESVCDSSDIKTDVNLAKAAESMIKMTERDVKGEGKENKPVEVKRSTSKEVVKKQNPTEMLKANRRLIEDFKRKKTMGKYKKMQENRHKLPAWNQQDDILQVISQHQVVVISGMTGCGKTTQVPQFILDLHLSAGDLHLCNILCTQPRRISAMAVAERVAEERADALGKIVGYQIRLEKMQSSMTRLLFCTTGIVLRRLEGDSTLDGVTHLIIDEVHERSEESDFLLMYLKDMLPNRPDLKIILMSATLNAQLFSDYFGGCAVVDIPGRTFPVDQYFLEDVIEFTGFIMEESSPYARPLKYMNAVQRGVAMEEEEWQCEGNDSGSAHKLPSDRVQDQNLSVKQLFLRYSDYQKCTLKNMASMDHTKINFDLVLDLMSWLVTKNHHDLGFPENGAILVFMPGYAEIQTLYDMLLSSPVFGMRNRQRYKIIPLHSTLSSEDQHAVFSKPPDEVTKIVIATNIAETSITIDDISFVIDTGKMKEKRYDSTKGMESLDTVWVSRANALQRKGRAGRVQTGICFHLFTSHRFDHHLQDQPIPEIQRAPLEQICLRIKMLDIFKKVPVEAVLHKLPEPPDFEAITSAIKRLEVLGALDSNGELTPLGYHLGTLPVDVRIGKLMLLGAIFRCLDSALTIAACLSFKSPFVTPFGKKREATEKKLEFAAGNSDHLTMLNAYNGWREARKTGGQVAYHYCHDNFLSKRSLEMLSSMKQQFTELLSDIGFVKEGISSRDVERLARNGEDGVVAATGPEANLNCKNLKLISALLVGALYPNIVQVLTPEQQYAQMSGGAVAVAPKAEDLRFKTKPDGYVKIHPSSVNFQVRYYESPYLVYHEKVKTTKIYIRDSTMVSVYPLLLFGGGQIGVDLSRGNFILSVDDGWIKFMAQSHQIAELVRELRLELDNLLEDKILNPHMDLCTCPRGSKIIDTIVKLITTQ